MATPTLTVDKEKCDGCATCVDVCPNGVFELKEGKSEPVNVDACVACEACVASCPNEAITVEMPG